MKINNIFSQCLTTWNTHVKCCRLRQQWEESTGEEARRTGVNFYHSTWRCQPIKYLRSWKRKLQKYKSLELRIVSGGTSSVGGFSNSSSVHKLEDINSIWNVLILCNNMYYFRKLGFLEGTENDTQLLFYLLPPALRCTI